MTQRRSSLPPLRPDPRECKHLDLGVERNLGIRWVTCPDCLQAFYPDWTMREEELVALWLLAEARWWAEDYRAHWEPEEYFPWEKADA